MARNSRCKGAAAVVMSVCLGLTGCLGSSNNEPPIMRSSLFENGTAPRASSVYNPGSPAYTGPAASLGDPRGNIQQTAYQAPANFGPDPGDKPLQPGETVVERPSLGMPVAGGMPPSFPQPIPTELKKTTHPPHRVAAPDTLFIEALRMIPRGPYRLEPLEVLAVEVPDTTLPNQNIRGNFMITPDGTINLGYNYGSVRIGGLTVDQAQQAIRDHLNNIIKNPTVNVALVQMRGMQNVRGEHLIRPDGTIHLGMYGSVYVAGMNLGQVKRVIEQHLSAYLVDPQISVDVMAYNSRKIYIVADGGGYGQQVIMLPCTGNETVLDAISMVRGLPPVTWQHKIWVARPSPAGFPTSTILPVDWKAIVQAGRTETNYQLMPGDRIYMAADPLITAYNYLDKMLAPVERLLGVTLLGANTSQVLRGNVTGVAVVR